jgi:DNA-binding NarL/FixJ family response regulator
VAADAWLQLGLPFEAAMSLLHDGSKNAADSCVKAAILFESIAAQAGTLCARRRAADLGATHLLPKRKRGPYAMARQHPLGLTQREELVLGLLAEGLSNAEIARRLNRSARTVEHHVSMLLSKVGASSRFDLISRISKQADIHIQPADAG